MAKKETETSATLSSSGVKYVVKQQLTLEHWKWVAGEVKMFTILTPIIQGAAFENAKAGADPNQKPPMLAEVINLETGERVELIFGKVLESTVTEKYPDNAYIGKHFRACQNVLDGKKYKGYSVDEIELA